MADPLAPLVDLVQVGVLASAAWLASLVLLAAAARLPGAVGRTCRAAGRRAAPVALHGLLGLAVTAGIAAPAAAAERPTPPPVSLDWPGTTGAASAAGPASAPSPGPASAVRPLPSVGATPSGAPTATATATPSTAPAASTPATAPTVRHGAPAGSVVVRPGDSLWALAARDLGPHAAPVRVAQEWPRWWAANRGVIGDDPDLIHPGTVLDRPASSQEAS